MRNVPDYGTQFNKVHTYEMFYKSLATKNVPKRDTLIKK